jgi:translation initiation factor 1
MGIVYSTEHGEMCPACGRPLAGCTCRKGRSGTPGSGQVRVGRETKGRKGKAVTVVSGLPLTNDRLRVLAGELKKKCGSGGTVKPGVIEIQGDHRDAIVAELVRRGYAAKRSGG